MPAQKSLFVWIAIALFVVAVAVAHLNRQSFGGPTSGYASNQTICLLSLGLSIAGGLALIAAAIDRRNRD
jgi:hypothetical protein